MSTKSTEPHFNVNEWMATHRDFVAWWKEHRDSGYSQNREYRERWGMPPWQAFASERYQAEYSGRSEVYDQEEISAMLAEQRKVEDMTGELEARFGPMFWETMTPAHFLEATKTIIREQAEKLEAKAKLDAAYSTEHGQSEKETSLLARRR